jgi:ceramide glucosyltransferase
LFHRVDIINCIGLLRLPLLNEIRLPSRRPAWTIAAPVFIPLLKVLGAVSVAATVASIGYCVLATVAALRFASARKGPRAITGELPPVSILKPLKGSDPEMYEALRSHCLQDYPDYEMLCGFTATNDPAIPVVEKLINEFPSAKIRVVLCDKRLGANGKVSSLIQLAAAATSEYIVVNDSDIRVQSDYLCTVISELLEPGVGLVTCLYRGAPGPTLGSRLEALGISTDFVPGVLAANLLEGGIHFGLGSTLAFRKADLEAIGGFETIVDYLADDYELGHRVSKHKKVQLSTSIVETHLPAYDFSGFLLHQLRWARTIRASRPGGYAGLLLTFTLPWALATVLLSSESLWAWDIAAAALLARVVLAATSSRLVLRDRNMASMWLLPIRDFAAVLVWLGGLFGNEITWREEKFTLERGKLRPK